MDPLQVLNSVGAALLEALNMAWEIASVWTDVVGGLLIAGALAAWVPDSFWRGFFLVDNPALAAIEGPLVGPLVAMLSFVCSVGNVPLAAVLWRGGISFGGVVSFIFADLIVLPILDIYRKYYGRRVALYILGTFYVTMAAAGYVVELVFGALGIVITRMNTPRMRRPELACISSSQRGAEWSEQLDRARRRLPGCASLT